MYESDASGSLISTASQERLAETKLLEARLLWADARLRAHAATKDDLIAKGVDHTAAYKSLLDRKAAALQSLQKLRGEGEQGGRAATIEAGDPPLPAWQPGEFLSDLPVAPLQIHDNTFLYGTSGFVQMPRATEGIRIKPNHQDANGEITTTRLRSGGGVEFSGTLVAPHEIDVQDIFNQDTFEWLHTWKYLVPFPVSAVRSRLTYSFDVSVNLSVSREHQPVDFLSFVSLGEEANLNPNSSIDVNIDAGWPLVADLTEPFYNTNYNGHYGWRLGRLTVQRSFYVSGGSLPAIAVVIGAAAILGRRAHCDFRFAGPASITPLSSADQFDEGRIAFHITPVGVLAAD